MKLGTKYLLTGDEISNKEFLELIDFSIKLKEENKMGKGKPLLENKTLAMLFEKPSTRTRVSFETGMLQLGGHTINLSLNDMQHSRGESVEDTAKTLSGYVDAIMSMISLRNLQNMLQFQSLTDYLTHFIHAKPWLI
jgi:ornithine carbamoyltransferase